MNWGEQYTSVVVSTSHLPEELATKMMNRWKYPFIYEETDYGYRLRTSSDQESWPEEIKPLMMCALDEGFRWVEFDRDGVDQGGFQTWEW